MMNVLGICLELVNRYHCLSKESMPVADQLAWVEEGRWTLHITVITTVYSINIQWRILCGCWLR